MLGDYLGLTCAALILTALASAVALESYIPKEDIELFVVQHLDLSTFRNSLGPQRKPGQRIFKDFGIAPTSIKKNEVEIDSEDWRYHIKILRRLTSIKMALKILRSVLLTVRSRVATTHRSPC
jgi:hypothetical protein